MNAYVWGVGTSMFAKQPELSTRELAWTAVMEALRDAEVDSVDAVYVGSCYGEAGVAQRALVGLGLNRIPILEFENACASSTTAYHEAVAAVQTGRYGSVLALGIEHLTSRFAGAIPLEPRDAEGRGGLAFPALYAMAAARYMAVYGVTPEQLAQVSVKNHQHGTGNPRAQHGRAVTLEQVLASPMVADPLTLFQCCAITDAGAAAVIGGSKRGPRDVAVRASAFSTGGLWDHETDHVWGFGLARDTAARAYEISGLGPEDIDLFEVHDAFTIGEIVTTEALGLAKEGDGVSLVMDGHSWIGGRQPVNPSGGLLSRGHPLGATGVAQVVEVVWQLRGDAGARQVQGARTGLVETLGGGVSGLDGNACVVSILSRG